ncbi:hypothetical protein FNH05_24340, partial [Amycolatopsis rhizosphaerae]
MTTATHSLDASSGTTTVAELLARNGAEPGWTPSSRRASDTLDATLPAIPVITTTPQRYRYDKNTVTALLSEPTTAAATAEGGKDGARTGKRIAGLAFAGAVLVGGWTLATAQAQDHDGPSSAEPVPARIPAAT